MRVLHLDYIQKQPVALLQKRIQEWMKLHIEWTQESDPWEQSRLTRKTHFQSAIIHVTSCVYTAQTEASLEV